MGGGAKELSHHSYKVAANTGISFISQRAISGGSQHRFSHHRQNRAPNCKIFELLRTRVSCSGWGRKDSEGSFIPPPTGHIARCEFRRGNTAKEFRMLKNRDSEVESYPMNGGASLYSYTENSYFQRSAANVAKEMMDEVIEAKLDVAIVSSTAGSTFRLADMGCSVGPNSFIAVQNIIDAVQHKFESKDANYHMPEFQVFFNDQASNDFNTLFSSLPPKRPYLANGVPGSFHGRLFPQASIHFVHSSYALQWLSKTPAELLNKHSPSWNKGRIHYTSATDEVRHAYATQYAKDMTIFLDARAQELVAGGLMVLIIPTNPHGSPPSYGPLEWGLDFLGFCLMDMAKDGLIDEALVDSFNMPQYYPSLKEMTYLVERNGFFSIERMEMTNTRWSHDDSINQHTWVTHLRAGLEGIFSRHFGAKIIDELFHRFHKKAEELSNLSRSIYMEGAQLFIVLKRV